MMISYKYRRIIIRIISFGLLCCASGFVFALIEKGILGEANEYPNTGNPYIFSNTIWIYTISSLMLGFFFGFIEVFFLEKLFRKTPFTFKLIFKTAFYVFIISFFFNIVTLWSSSAAMGLSILHPEVLNTSKLFFSNSLFIAVLLYGGGLTILFLFIFEINDNLGQGIVINFLMGKYHFPRKEQRIFMFVDLNASTVHAERMKPTNYFEFLKTYYADMTNSIEKYSGRVYQYVGDEIVISWKVRTGIKNNNCLKCFFSLKETFAKLSKKYEKKFNLIPKFKASIHMGTVVTGEIGVLKKEIFFTGDVLNTTSRMESMCHQYNTECLISEPVYEKLKPNNDINIDYIGQCKLKGKNQQIKLYTANLNSEQ